MVSGLTKVLLANDSGNTIRNMMPWTAPDVLTFIPTNTEIQQKHSAKAIEMPMPADAASALVSIRKPMIMPKPRVTTQRIRYRPISAMTAPTSGTERPIGSERNRSKTPFSMSEFRFWPSDTPAWAIDWASRPGSRNCR